LKFPLSFAGVRKGEWINDRKLDIRIIARVGFRRNWSPNIATNF
jgi:hypothetical protein